MMGPEEENITQEAVDFKVFNDLYVTHYPRFVYFARTYLGDASTAEDFVAESFMAYWNNRNNLEPNSNIRAYIMTTLKNKCLNHLRQKGFRDESLRRINHDSKWELDMRINTLKACDPVELFSSELQEMIDKAIKKLPNRTLEVFTLSRYQNKSNKEIAASLEISVKGVEFHMSKALAVLREELKDYLPALLFLGLFQ